ncbi:MAG: cobalt transporter CbiM [Caulobacteraceae bacterium]
MHIPDGYLSLETTVPAIGAMLPIWAVALKKVKRFLKQKQIPLLSLCAAFSFVIMMFNVPLGESSVHAVGAVFIAILLGPWSACIAVSTALFIQALVFGDGGILAIGVNCFNMAFVMPFSGYYIYKAVTGKADITSKKGLFGIFTGSYAGINLAALCAAIEFGIQPLLFKAADGSPLYGYYPLSVSVPVMMFEHGLFAGPVEGIVTVAAILYIAKFAPHLLHKTSDPDNGEEKAALLQYKSFIAGLAVLIILTPLGLMATGTAWGEWGAAELKNRIGFIPKGFSDFSDLWKAVIPDYSISGLNAGFFSSALGYIISAIVGIAVISVVIYISARLIMKEQKKNE